MHFFLTINFTVPNHTCFNTDDDDNFNDDDNEAEAAAANDDDDFGNNIYDYIIRALCVSVKYSLSNVQYLKIFRWVLYTLELSTVW
jgi:hypothetical protein